MKQLRKVDGQRKKIMNEKLDDFMTGRLLGDDRHFPAVVYAIQSPAGETYYGSTDVPGIRFSNHIRDLSKSKHINKALQSAWDKCGGLGFTFTIVSEHYDRRSAFEAELNLINSKDNLMNAPRNKKESHQVLTPAQINAEIEMEILRLKEDPF